MSCKVLEVDPLSTYDYAGYESYTAPQTCQEKREPTPQPNIDKETPIEEPKEAESSEPDKDVKAEIKPVMEKPRDRKSSYWNEKITDKSFAFYGCAVCNVSFKELRELDQHVTVHKNRMTSYELRLKNMSKRKLLKKEKRKLKKKKHKNVDEAPLDIEIKPEDGYIGTEKAEDYVKTENEKNTQDATKPDVVGNPENVTNPEEVAAKDDNTSTDVKEPKQKNNQKEMEKLEKVYQCFACKKLFSLSYYLRLHVRSHTDEKPYTCSVCGQSFITASKLGRHTKRIHLAVRHQCRICYRFFSKFEILVRHFDKKHADDKIEGEPYDFNAILPYLKEIEEELKMKLEDDKKPKTEELWWTGDGLPAVNDARDVKSPGGEDNKDFPMELLPTVEVQVEAPVDLQIDIKEELEDAPDEPADTLDDAAADDDCVNNDDAQDVKDECYSDDDYFPANTWAATPKIEMPPDSPPPKRGKASKGLECEVCQKRISSATYLKVHMRIHSGEKPFKCYVCGRGFITSSKMHRHVLTHEESWKEVGALKEDDTNKEGEKETEEVTNDDEKSIIKKAKEKFTKKQKKDSTNGKTRQKRSHACEFCHKKFLHPETLQVHKRSHSSTGATPQCGYCLERVCDAAALRAHEAAHAGPKPYVCTLCGKTYKKKESMVYHRKQHRPAAEEVCDICSKRFPGAAKLRRHLASHRAGRYALRYECPVCAHMFHTRHHVQMHLATHQREGLIMEENRNDILAMVLQNARKIPKQPDAPHNLTDPLTTDERSRICNICGEVFQHFYYLEEHLKSHGSKIAIEDLNKVEEKKYTCTVCSKSFKLHYYLKLHTFTHTKEKPFICQQCGKGFITRGKLKRHLETHTGLKKYQCHICYKFFTRPSYLRIHIRTIHGTQDYNFRLDRNNWGVKSNLAESV